MIRDPKSVPVPDRMKHLPRDPRGFPIFVMAAREPETGKVLFTVNEESQRQKCIHNDLCSICGTKLNRGRWFAGGPLSAFHPQGTYLDPPMHIECLHFALIVCPYLAREKYNNYISDHLRTSLPRVKDQAMSDRRPEVFVVVMATGIKKHAGEMQITNRLGAPVKRVAFTQYVRPHRPYNKVEFWRHGERIDYATAITLMNDDELQALGEYIAKHGPVSRKVAA